MLKNSVCQGENFLTQSLSLQQSLELRKITSDTENNMQTKDIEKGLYFILSHFDVFNFPRTISTFKSQNKQIMVRSKEETLRRYKESSYVDCRINAFPSLKEGVSWAPDFISIDLDLADFKSKRALDLALYKTLKNIQERLKGFPTVLSTGGGYHIYQPIQGIEFEHYKDFNEFSDLNLFNEFLRFSKNFLSNGKADKQNNPSLKSCLLRIPGSINAKHKTEVRITQKWDGYRPYITKLIGNFSVHLVDLKLRTQRELTKNYHLRNNIQYNANTIPWIEKLLETPIEDERKYALWKILCPYLINVKKISYKESFNILENWLDRCDCCNKLSFNTKYEIQTKLRHVKSYLPISLSKLKIDNPDFFKTLQDMKIFDN